MIRGGGGTIGGSHYFGHQMILVNGGLISTDVADRTLTVLGASFTNNGTARAINGGTLNVSATNPFTNAGTVAAGIGSTVTVSGSFSQNVAATINVNIGGTSAGQFGTVSITGTANLAGTLRATLVGGFTPSVGNSFQVLTYSARTGTFGTVDSVNIPAGQAFNPTYNPTNLTLVDVAAGAGSGESIQELSTARVQSLGQIATPAIPFGMARTTAVLPHNHRLPADVEMQDTALLAWLTSSPKVKQREYSVAETAAEYDETDVDCTLSGSAIVDLAIESFSG